MQHIRIADATAGGGRGVLDATAFEGVWHNTNPDTRGIARVDYSTRDGALAVRVHAAGPEGTSIDWGETHDTTLYSSTLSSTGTAFWAQYEFGFMDAVLLGYVNRGVLVLSCYSVFKDGSGRVNYFGREYYSRIPSTGLAAAPARPEATVDDKRLAKLEDLQVPIQGAGLVNLAPLCGTWANTKTERPDVAQVQVLPHEGGLALRVRSLGLEGPIDWPEAQAQVYQCIEEDSKKGLTLLATFDPGFMEIHAELRFNKGVLVLATWNGFKDRSGRSNYFTREFFHRISE